MKSLFAKIKDFTKKYSTYLKLIISAVILYFIFTKVDISAVGTMLTNIPTATLLIVITICITKFFSQAFLWQFCLNITEANEDGNFLLTLKTHTIGMALRFLVPGGYATFGKALYYPAARRKEAFYSTLVEKFFLTWIVWFMASWAFIMIGKLPKIDWEVDAIWSIVAIPFAIIISLLPFLLIFVFKKYVKYEHLVNYVSSLPFLLIIQILYICLTFVQYFLVLQALTPEMNLNIISIAMTIAIVLVANTIPISFSGLGLREGAAAILLAKLGIAPEIAISAALFDFFLNAVVPVIPAFYLILKKDKV